MRNNAISRNISTNPPKHPRKQGRINGTLQNDFNLQGVHKNIVGTSNRFDALNTSHSCATKANSTNLQLNEICKMVVGVPNGFLLGQRNIDVPSLTLAKSACKQTQQNPRAPLIK